MSNVVAFPQTRAIKPREPRAIEGATMFMHMRKVTLIAHLSKPRANRSVAMERKGKA